MAKPSAAAVMDVASPQVGSGALSTLMIKNLPSRCQREDVLTAIDTLGFEGAYDFFYLPMRYPKPQSTCFGYAFINFIDPLIARRFEAVAHDSALSIRGRPKVVRVVVADIQGIDNLMVHFEGKAIMRRRTAPLFAGSMPTTEQQEPPASCFLATKPSSPSQILSTTVLAQPMTWLIRNDDLPALAQDGSSWHSHRLADPAGAIPSTASDSSFRLPLPMKIHIDPMRYLGSFGDASGAL
eukprot:TRINITY_DN112973_c0_g1_i1.p1 TRINITY_DN112973_c0_g1~~TRINITY_DN112973_c0_g1_i1.p1  ORF type:complete len:250 (+),score=45.41 TRINITY_DN112973_c0_g1_i1:34-750(+)